MDSITARLTLISFIKRERWHRERVFRKDPEKLAAKVAQCDDALKHLDRIINGGSTPFVKSYRHLKTLIKGEHFWRGKIFSGQVREDKLAECNEAFTALEYLNEMYAPQPEAEQLSLIG